MLRIFIRPGAKQVIQQWARDQDMTETGLASRIYEWFGEQPEELQRGILGLYGSQTRAITFAALARLANPEQTRGQDKPAGEGLGWYVDRILDPEVLGSNKKPKPEPKRRRAAG